MTTDPCCMSSAHGQKCGCAKRDTQLNLIRTLAIALDNNLEYMAKRTAAEARREEGKSMRQVTKRNREEWARKAVAEAFKLLKHDTYASDIIAYRTVKEPAVIYVWKYPAGSYGYVSEDKKTVSNMELTAKGTLKKFVEVDDD